MNPNPYLEDKSELAMGAREKGMSFTQLVGRILESAAKRYGLLQKAEKPEKASKAEPETAAPPPTPPTATAAS